MGLFGNKVVAATELKLSDVIPNYDYRMNGIINIGKCLYRGYLPDSALALGGFGYLTGFHDYKIYTNSKKSGQVKRRKTLQIPKFTSEYLNKLIYTEKVDVSITSESNPSAAKNLHEFIHDVIDDNDYWNNTAGLAETMWNMGGKVEKPTIANDKIKIDFVTADRFFPLDWDNKYVYSGVFVTNFQKGGYYYTKLTWYKKVNGDYKVEKELYKAKDAIKLGQKIGYNTVFDDARTYTLTDWASIPFTYTKPRIKNNQVLNSPLGIPIWFNAIDTIGSLDLTFDTKFREVRYGGRTKIVPSYAMKQKIVKDNSGTKTYQNVHDPDDPTYSSFNLDPSLKNSQGIVDLTSPIRDVSFTNLMNQDLDLLAIQLGFSTGSFVFDGKSMKTATEVISEKESSYQTKVNQERALEVGHSNLFLSCIEMASAFEIDSRVTVIPEDLVIHIEFDDSIIIDNEKFINDMIIDANESRIPDWMPVAKRYNLEEKEARELVLEAQAMQDDLGLDGILIQEEVDDGIEEE